MTNQDERLLALLRERETELPYTVDAVYADFQYMLNLAPAQIRLKFWALSPKGLIALVDKIIAIGGCSTDEFARRIKAYLNRYKEGE